MLPNTYHVEQYIRMRHQEMIKEAPLVQLSWEIKGEKPKLWQKLAWRMGDWMIDMGCRLKREQLLTSQPCFSPYFCANRNRFYSFTQIEGISNRF